MSESTSVSPIGSPSTSFDAPFDVQAFGLRAACGAIENKDLQGCYSFLKRLIGNHVWDGGLSLEQFDELFPCIQQLQQQLAKQERWKDFDAWVAPQQDSLLAKLAEHLLKEPHAAIADRLLALFTEGVYLLPADPGHLERRRNYLELAFRCAKKYQRSDLQRKWIYELGKVYLSRGNQQPIVSSAHEDYQKASICFNIAQHKAKNPLAPLTSVEGAFLEHAATDFARLIHWAKHHIFPNGTNEAVWQVISIAERLIDYGQFATARALYAHVDNYVSKHTFPRSEEVRRRFWKLEEYKSRRKMSWQQERECLADLRRLTGCLFASTRKAPKLGRLASQIAHASARPLANGDWRELLSRELSIHQLQEVHGNMLSTFAYHLYQQALTIVGTPPCKYALVGTGSLARGSMCVYSDLDAVVLVDETSPAITTYFQKVGHLFSLMVRNLGETRCKDFLGFQHLKDGFCLDVAALHPAKTILTVNEYLGKISTEVDSLELSPHNDIDALAHALSMPAFIGGNPQLFQTLGDELDQHLGAENRGSRLATQQLRRWKGPSERSPTFDAKDDLYRPIHLLIDALALLYGSNSVRTVDRIAELRQHLPGAFVDLLARALTLACRLRMGAHLHYGQERETVHVRLTGREERPILLHYSTAQALDECNHLLFPFAKKVAAAGTFELVHWEEAKRAYLDKLIEWEQLDRLEQAVELGISSTKALAILALWNGHFQQACEFDRQAQQAFATYQALPNSPPLASLIGKLYFLRDRGYRQDLAPPPAGAFNGTVLSRIAMLRNYLTSVEVPETVARKLWEYAEECRVNKRPFPDSKEALVSQLCGEESLDALLYRDILNQIALVLAGNQTLPVLLAIHQLLPRCLRAHFIKKLELADCDRQTIEHLAHIPQRDGSRPLDRSEPSKWDILHIGGKHLPRFNLVGGPQTGLSQTAAEALTRLHRDRPMNCGGRHPIVRSGDTFYKLDPEFPGRAFALLRLWELITGYVYPPRALLRVNYPEEPCAVEASQAVEGPSLQAVLAGEKAVSFIHRIDDRHYCFSVLMAILCRPEDASPENYIARETRPGGPVELVDIDPDRTFFNPMTNPVLSRKKIQCKCILFCFDLMRRPIEATVRAEFLALEPALVLSRWLDQLAAYDQGCLKTFKKSMINKGLVADPIVEIPFFIEPTRRSKKGDAIRHRGLLLDLYDRFELMKRHIKANPNLRLIDLLLTLEPTLGPKYAEQLDVENKRPIDRWCDLTNGLYKKRASGQTVSLTSSKLRGRHKSYEEYQKHGWTIGAAKKDLECILRAHDNQEDLISDLVNGDGSRLTSLNLPEVSDAAVKAITFPTHPIEAQKKIIQRITTLTFRSLHLNGCQVIDDERLSRLLGRSSGLKLLDLSAANSPVNPASAIALCQELKKLILSHIPSLKEFSIGPRLRRRAATLPALKTIDISHCPRLDRLLLNAPALQELRCCGPHFPAIVELEAPNLKKLIVDERPILARFLSQVQPDEVLYKNLRIVRLLQLKLATIREARGVFLIDQYLVFQPSDDQMLPELDLIRLMKGDYFCVQRVQGDATPVAFIVRLDPRQRMLPAWLKDANARRLTLDLNLFSQSISGADLQTLAIRCTQLQTLGLAALPTPTPPQLLAYFFRSSLTRLDLPYCQIINDKALRLLGARAKGIHHLNLKGCNQITTATIVNITSKLPLLDTLDISGASQFSEAGVCDLARRCPKLLDLSLPPLKSISFAALNCLATSCPSLERLVLNHWFSVLEGGHIDPFSALRILDLTDSDHPSNLCLAMAKWCPNLEHLFLSPLMGVDPTLVEKITHSCSRLTGLDLSEIIEWPTERVLGPLPRLRVLRLPKLVVLSDAKVVEMVGLRTSLHTLQLAGSGLTDEGFSRLADPLSQLQELRLINCSSLTSRAIRSIPDGALYRVCHIERCPRIDTNAVIEFLQSQRNLRHLSLEGNGQLRENAFLTIARVCPDLTILRLSGCNRLTDRALIAIAQSCPGLEVLALNGCTKITDDAIVALAEACPNLTSLDLRQLDSLTDTSLTALDAHCPNLRTIDLGTYRRITSQRVDRLKEKRSGAQILGKKYIPPSPPSPYSPRYSPPSFDWS